MVHAVAAAEGMTVATAWVPRPMLQAEEREGLLHPSLLPDLG
jgi:hypothetical protein